MPHIELLLEGARAVLAERENARFVLVQQGGGGAAFARTLYLEAPQVTTCVVNVPVAHPQAVEWVLAEARAAVGYSEAHYDASGRRREAVLRLLPLPEELAEPSLDQMMFC
jgi:enediyne polyketide synthase